MVRVENRVELINNGMKKTDERMRDYEQNLQEFNDMCEDVMSDRRTIDAAVNILYDKVERLEADQHTLNESNQKLNETVRGKCKIFCPFNHKIPTRTEYTCNICFLTVQCITYILIPNTCICDKYKLHKIVI